MSIIMKQNELKALASELAKDIKTPEDLSALTAHLTKITVEAALNAELDHHLGYTQYESKGHHSGNSRNGYRAPLLTRVFNGIRDFFLYFSMTYKYKIREVAVNRGALKKVVLDNQ